jgi:hypothetical protein
MKNKTAYIYLICFGLLLNSSTIIAQTGSEIKFKLLNESSNAHKGLVTVSTAINTKQLASGNGIHFTLIVKNNSCNTISTKNIVNQLSVSLFNELGLDISVPNEALNDVKINRRAEDRKWRFRSESVVLDRVYTNGKEDKRDLKMQEYIEIPAGGDFKINLVLRNVKQVETPQDVQDRILKPTKSLSAGIYKLKLFLSIVSNEQNKSGGFIASFQSPMIDIDYSK